VHQERLDRALAIVDALGLPPGSRALEIGCGAGLATVGLASRGLSVDAIDASPAMVASAIEEARRAGVADQVTAQVADAHALEAEDATYDLVLALGVLPWLDAPAAALAEIRRVLAPGGRVVMNVDNKFRASTVLDPRASPLLAPAQGALRRRLAGLGVLRTDPVPIAAAQGPGRFDDLVARAGLEKEEGLTLGFGPFTVFNREPLPAPLGTRLHRRLQELADRGVPLVRHAGAQYLVVARRPSHDALASGTPR
jgi:SAM-dependent methyltransferase